LFEAITGYRMINHNYFRVGGVGADLPYGWVEKCADFCTYFLPVLGEYERLMTDNPIFRRRLEGIGVLPRELAIEWGISGPMLRASGVKWDLRKVDHYECYDDFEWKVHWDTAGDCFARYRVRMDEMRESIKIIRQAIVALPGGDYANLEAKRMASGPKSEWNSFDYQFIAKKIAPTFKIPKGEHYVRVESGRGELGIFIIGDDTVFPWRWKIRPADFNNLQVLPYLIRDRKVADIFVILANQCSKNLSAIALNRSQIMWTTRRSPTNLLFWHRAKHTASSTNHCIGTNLNTRSNKAVSRDPHSISNLDRGRLQSKRRITNIVISSTKIRLLRNHTMGTDANASETIKHNIITNPAKVSNVNLPRISESRCRANQNAFANRCAKPSKNATSNLIKRMGC
jgi:hypothetical protein